MLTAHSQGSLKENPPASTFTAETAPLQRQPGRETVGEERGGDKQRDKQACRETDGREDKPLLSFLLSRAPMKLTPLPACPSGYLTTFPPSPPLAACHLFLSVSPPSPAPYPSDSLSLLHHPHSLLLSLRSPPSPSPDTGCVCRLRHFCQSVCEDQRKVLQCRLRRRLCNAAPGPGQTHSPIPKRSIHK